MSTLQKQIADYLNGTSNKLPDIDAVNIVEARQMVAFVSGIRDVIDLESWDKMVELMEYVYEVNAILSKACSL